MAFCTYTELQNLSGSDLSSTILEAIIADGDREIDAYLAPYNLTGSAAGAVKTASLKLGQAGVMVYGAILTGTGLFGIRLMVEELRKEAFWILDKWIAENSTSSSSYKMVVRV